MQCGIGKFLQVFLHPEAVVGLTTFVTSFHLGVIPLLLGEEAAPLSCDASSLPLLCTVLFFLFFSDFVICNSSSAA